MNERLYFSAGKGLFEWVLIGHDGRTVHDFRNISLVKITPDSPPTRPRRSGDSFEALRPGRKMLLSDPAARLREAPAGEFDHARCSLLRSKVVRINGVRSVGMAGGDWIKNTALENCCEGDFFGGNRPPKKEGFSPCPLCLW
jgi:hypothetical protein